MGCLPLTSVAIPMKILRKFLTTAFLLSVVFLPTRRTQAQTLAKNTDWIQKQLNKLVTDDAAHAMNLNGKKSTPKFDFNGCQMNMILDSQDKDVLIGMNIGWQLKDVRTVSYRQDKNGQYVLVLNVPTDKVKMSMGVGGFSGSFNADDKDSKGKDNTSSFSLDTKDESLVRQLKQKLEESVPLCRQGKNGLVGIRAWIRRLTRSSGAISNPFKKGIIGGLSPVKRAKIPF